MRREFQSSFLTKYVFPFAVVGCLLLSSACTRDKIKKTSVSGYPDNIAEIVDNKCSTAGCHNTQSKAGAAGLDMSTWDKAMEGGTGGAVIIPFYHKQSSVFLFTNTDSTLGAHVIPTMPYNQPPLSRDEVITLRDWIDNGAPNKDGFVKFSDNPDRHKIYITNQGCDLVAVVDADSKLVMRYIPVGSLPGVEATHRVMVSHDGSFWCVSFLGGYVLEKFGAANDDLLGEINIGYGSWNSFAITQDGTKAYCVDWNAVGRVAEVDLINYTSTIIVGDLIYPHGSALSADEKYLYVTGQTGNCLYKIDLSDPLNYTQISVDGNPIVTSSASLDIHDIIFSPDKSKYFLTCERSNEVRVMNAANDSLIAVIPVGDIPQELAVSTSSPYLFTTCMNDNFFAPNVGSVSIINYNTLIEEKRLYTGWQPHGVAVDDNKKLVYVANRNLTGGPAPHHTTDCGGRNGYFTLIDLNTLEMVPSFKTELTPDPYSCAYR